MESAGVEAGLKIFGVAGSTRRLACAAFAHAAQLTAKALRVRDAASPSRLTA
jgi:hypothetical protein